MDVTSSTSQQVSIDALNNAKKTDNSKTITQTNDPQLQDAEDSPNASVLIKKSRRYKKLASLAEKEKKKTQEAHKQTTVTKAKLKNQEGHNNEEQSDEEYDKEAKKALSDITTSSSLQEITAKMSEKNSDPYAVSAKLAYAVSYSSNTKIKDNIKKALTKFSTENKSIISAGQNINPVVQKYKTLAPASDIRILYNKTILGDKSYVTTADTVLQKFPDSKHQTQALDFLLEASGKDLEIRGIPRTKSMVIMENIKKARVLLTIKKMFEDDGSFVMNAIKGYKIKGSIPTIYEIYKRFISILITGRITSTQIVNQIHSIVPKKDPLISNAISDLMLKNAKKIPLEFFKVMLHEDEKSIIGNRSLFLQSMSEAHTFTEKDADTEVNLQVKNKANQLLEGE